MKILQAILFLSIITLLSSACVTRTTSIEPEHRGDPAARNYGGAPKGEVIDTQRIWIWQKAFRDPK
jgi:hypothetical protein